MVYKRVFGFLLALTHPVFKITFQNFSTRFACDISSSSWGSWAVVSLSTFPTHFRICWVLVWCGKQLWSKGNCLHYYWSANFDLKWYVMHVWQCILFIFGTLFMGVHIIYGWFWLLIHILNVSFKFRAG